MSLWDDIKDGAKAALPFLGAGLDFFGGLLGNSANAEEASRNRQFVAKMYKKRYQFTVDDMRKAGLNPVLASNGGNVGSISSTPTASFDNPFHGAISSAVSTANAVQDVQNKIAQRSLTESQTGLNQSKKVSQDIENKYLDSQARALAERAQHDASIANSASEIQRARAQYAESLARSEEIESRYRASKTGWDERKSYYDQDRAWRDPEHTLLPFERKDLYLREKNADILRKQMAPFWQGVNSASRVFIR